MRHGAVVEDRHALARHLVAATGAIRIREALEVAVHLGGDIDGLGCDAETLTDRVRVECGLGITGPVGHEDRHDVAGAERRNCECGHQRRIDTAREADDDPFEAHLANAVGDEAAKQTGYEAGVNRERVGGGVCRSLRR